MIVYIDTHGDGKRNAANKLRALVAPTSGVFIVKLGSGKTATGNNFADDLTGVTD